MSELRAQYLVSAPEGGLPPATLLLFTDPGYTPPSWEDMRFLMKLLQLTGSAVANITGVLPRTARKWTSPPDASNHSPVPYAAWRLLLIYGKLVPAPELPSDK